MSTFRYILYGWTKEDIDSYNKTYGADSFKISDSLTNTLKDFGYNLYESNELDKILKAYLIAEDGLKNGVASIYDRKERLWFN